jgi:hypothetical protein
LLIIFIIFNKNFSVFCKVRVGTQKVRSRTMGGSSPQFNETLLVCYVAGDALMVAVWDKRNNLGVTDHHIGTAIIDSAGVNQPTNSVLSQFFFSP